MTILIHITPQGPVGAWRVVHGGLESYYTIQAAEHDADAAEAIISLKSNDLSWNIWFDRLVDRSPYFLKFVKFEAPASEALSDSYERFLQETMQ